MDKSCIFDFILVRAPPDKLRTQLAEVTGSYGAVEVTDVLSGAFRLKPTRGIEWEASHAVTQALSRIFGAALFGAWNDQISIDHGYLYENGDILRKFGVPFDEQGYLVDEGPWSQNEGFVGIAIICALDEFAPGHGLDHDDLLELFGFKVYGFD